MLFITLMALSFIPLDQTLKKLIFHLKKEITVRKNSIKLFSGLFVFLILSSTGVFASGDLKWNVSFGVDGATWSTPAVVGDYLYLQDQEGGIGSHKISDGTRVWYKSLSTSWNVSSPVYKNGKLYLFTASTLYCLDAEDGETLAQFTANSGIGSQAPAMTDGLLFFSTSTKIYAIDTDTFTEVWSKTVASVSNLMVYGNIVYAVGDNLYALTPTDGSVLWQVSPPLGGGFHIGAVDGNYLAAFTWHDTSTSKSRLVAYQLSSSTSTAPTELWSAEMGNMADNSPPVIGSGTVYATSREGVLRAYSLSGSGTPLWERTVRSSGTASALPITVAGNVYIQEDSSDSDTYSLVCLDGSTGGLIWQSAKTDLAVSWGEPVLVNNVIYVATDHGGGLFAFDAGTVDGNWYMMKQNPSLTGYDTGYTPSDDSSSSGGDSDSGGGSSDNTDDDEEKEDDDSSGCFIRSLFNQF